MLKKTFERGLIFLLLPLLVLAIAPAGVAQIQTGRITGVVTDEQGGALPGVTVTLESPALLRAQTDTTNERGAYSFISLPPGVYRVVFSLPGFAATERSGIRVNVAVVTTVDQTLRLATVTETVTVTGESPIVDTKSASKGTNFDTELLTNIPQAREIWSTVEQVPGATMSKFNVGGAESAQQSSMQIHGSAAGQQEYAINGLKLNWPGGNGGATAFYFDHDSFAEINIMTNGAPAEVGTGGVYMNMVTRSGGNALKGGSSIFWEDDSFQGDNVSDDLRALGVSKGNPINFIYDFNAHLGGPIKTDKVWFFGSYRRYDINTQILGITRPDGSPAPDVNHQSNAIGKVTAQLNEKNKLSGEFNFNYQNRFFRRPTTDLVEEKASWRQIEPAYITQFQWTSLLTEKLFLDARFGYLHLIFPLRYQDSVAANDFARVDIIRQTLRDAAIYDFENLATRHQVNVSATYFMDDWAGEHTFKTGFEYGRAFNQNFFQANGNYVLRYFDGAPLEVQTYNTPVTSKNFINTISAYFQDNWVVNRRLTLNYGVRFERLVGFAPEQERSGNEFFPAERFGRIEDIPRWADGAWRFGAAYDLTGDGRTALKGFVGRYLLQEGTRLVQQVNPNDLGGDFRSWNDINGNNIAEPNELGPSTRPYGGRVNKIDPDLKRPYSDEFNIGVERELRPNLSMGVTYFRRQNRRLFSGVNRAVPPSAYTPITVQGPEGPVTVFNQDRATLGRADRLITNVPGLRDTYNGVEISATKRMADRWQLLAGLTIGKGEGLFDRGLNDDHNNPNLNLNRENAIVGMDSTYVGKIVGTYIFPREITFSTNLRYFTGQPVLKQITVRGLNQGTVSVLAEPRGETRLDNVTLWDIRASKIFSFSDGRREIEVMVDVFNLLNQDARTVINTNLGPVFGRPIAILPPRVARLGFRVAF
jgi:hypothetical protein